MLCGDNHTLIVKKAAYGVAVQSILPRPWEEQFHSVSEEIAGGFGGLLRIEWPPAWLCATCCEELELMMTEWVVFNED